MMQHIPILKKNNIRITPQRLLVYKILTDDKGHLTAEEIYEKVKPKLPAVSLATVYTVLELFKEKHLVNEIRIQFDKSCFEAKVDAHHHFFCRICKKIFDICMKPCHTLEKKEVEGHAIEKLQGYFYGLCKNCKNK